MKVYQTCLETIQIYVQCNSNRFTIDPTAEEDSYRDIFLLMRLLTHFLNMDIFNLIDKQNESRVKPVEVFFDGLNIIMPLITTDLLKFPSVCSQ
jgi:methanogenic corrinoid protein MtbC1